jgi:hypothetical protein
MNGLKAAACGIFFALAAPTTALAASCSAANVAEVQRLSGELRKALTKNQNSGGDNYYKAMEKLGAACAAGITPVAHFDGGLAARGLGNLGAAKARFERAPDLAEAKNELTALGAYGQVSITKTPKAKRALIFEGEAPFDPLQRLAIDFGKAEVAAGRDLVGLLPPGNYKLGSVAFSVTTSKPVALKSGKLKK